MYLFSDCHSEGVRRGGRRGIWPSRRSALPRRSPILLAFGLLLQVSGCAFDTQALLSDSLAVLYENIATTFIINSLADLLNVAPTF